MDGLLIINADDWGGGREATDAAATAFRAGAVTSATAMVHMGDAARAAEIARELGLPTGLHLNLTQPFDAPGVPAGVRERQARLAERLWPLTRRRRLVPSPRPAVQAAVRDAIRDQLDAFRALYGREPTHLDGHNDIHCALTVLRELPAGLPVRRSGARHSALIAWRFATTAEFHAVHDFAPELGGTGLDELPRRARSRTIELMTHPARPGELDALLGDAWQATLAASPLGTFADLPARRHAPAVAAAVTCAALLTPGDVLTALPV